MRITTQTDQKETKIQLLLSGKSQAEVTRCQENRERSKINALL